MDGVRPLSAARLAHRARRTGDRGAHRGVLDEQRRAAVGARAAATALAAEHAGAPARRRGRRSRSIAARSGARRGHPTGEAREARKRPRPVTTETQGNARSLIEGYRAVAGEHAIDVLE